MSIGQSEFSFYFKDTLMGTELWEMEADCDREAKNIIEDMIEDKEEYFLPTVSIDMKNLKATLNINSAFCSDVYASIKLKLKEGIDEETHKKSILSKVRIKGEPLKGDFRNLYNCR